MPEDFPHTLDAAQGEHEEGESHQHGGESAQHQTPDVCGTEKAHQPSDSVDPEPSTSLQQQPQPAGKKPMTIKPATLGPLKRPLKATESGGSKKAKPPESAYVKAMAAYKATTDGAGGSDRPLVK